jgi:DNA polymerase-3 subunit epsilon
MNITLIRPIVGFDLETTGDDVCKDRIVEIHLTKIHPDGRQEKKTRRLNPTIPIHPGASEVHGIVDAMVKKEPTFANVAKSLFAFLEGCDLITYNGKRFDVPLLAEEFARCDIDFPADDVVHIDVFLLYSRLFPRTLSAAVKQFLGREHEGAHGAASDVEATVDVLECIVMELKAEAEEGQVDSSAVDTSPQGLAAFAENLKPGEVSLKRIDPAGKLIENEDGDVVWNFGKYKGQRVVDTDAGFIGWVLKQDFPETTKRAVRLYRP